MCSDGRMERKRIMDDRSNVVLKLNGVSKSFAKVEQDEVTHALDHVDLEMESGEFISLVGPSGCGKSTVLRLVAGLIRPTLGSVTVKRGRRTIPAAGHGVSEADAVSVAHRREKHCVPIESTGEIERK